MENHDPYRISYIYDTGTDLGSIRDGFDVLVLLFWTH
jgi:hypothetical protein